MKLQVLLSALSCAGGVLAATEISNNPDGSLLSIHYTPDSVAPFDAAGPLRKRDCTRNNCLRALVARPDAATAFCRAFTTAVSTNVAPFTQCAGPDKASTACSCVVPPPTSTSEPPTSTTSTTSSTSTSTTPPAPTCSPPGGFCTINTFIEDCCHAPDGSVGCYFPNGDPFNGECFN